LSSKISDAGNAYDLIVPRIVRKLKALAVISERRTIIDPSTTTGEVQTWIPLQPHFKFHTIPSTMLHGCL
jgi:hypothetical protein